MTATAEALLDAHRWNHRILLLFYPQDNDARALAVRQNIAELSCGFKDRDLLVGMFPMKGESRFADEQIPPSVAAEIRRHFNVSEPEFAVVLLGKDGGEKLRVNEVPDIDAVFELIDGMPMRIAELREQNRGCPG